MTCRRCLHWKRKGFDFGVCWFYQVLTVESEGCDEFTAKVSA